jgi:hypothetical protein
VLDSNHASQHRASLPVALPRFVIRAVGLDYLGRSPLASSARRDLPASLFSKNLHFHGGGICTSTRMEDPFVIKVLMAVDHATDK